MNAIALDHISKSFGEVTAVNDVSLEVRPGELFGLIGPDGAGKTTLIRIITTLLIPDSGKATILGSDSVIDYAEIRSQLGYMPGRFSLYSDLSVLENLNFFATIFGSTFEENRHLIQDMYTFLEPFKHRKAGALSGGMKQKLALCCALIHKPKLLILDEPTTGVDAVSRREFWDMLDRIKEEGTPILVSTPYMDEAERCDTIALMQDGQIMASGTPEAIRAQFEGDLFAIRSLQRYQVLKAFREHPKAISVHPFGEHIHVTFSKEETMNADSLIDFGRKHGISDVEVFPYSPSIEDRFMALMEKSNV